MASRFRRKISRSSRNITITCRGKIIDQEELFSYTNGHFLVNAEYQYRQRYLKFDISQLCAVAAAAGNSKSPIVAVEKMEGGFCKALLMKKADGTEVVAKLPSKLVRPPKYSTASEVATLKYVQQHTKVPVPKVLEWNCDPSNSVGCEYIIMEKAPGVQLYTKWGDMSGTSRIALAKHLGELESQLACIHFPVSGSLFLRDTATGLECQPLCKTLDPSQSYCIGPSIDRSWYTESGSQTPSPKINNGPWSSLHDYGISLAKREISRISTAQNRSSRPFRHLRTTDEEISDLKAAMQVIEILQSRHVEINSLSRPILWHTDLHLGNIFVSDDDPTRIVSIIDWQYVTLGPLFLRATWPDFLKPNDEYVYGAVRPQLPDNFEQLDIAEQKLATLTRDDAIITKSYELRSSLLNKDVYRSLNLPPVFLEIFVRCGEAGDEGTIGLRACLAELYKSWASLGFIGECPIAFTTEELLRIEHEFKEYRDWYDIQEFARSYLDTDSDGWISPELDIVEVQQRNKSALERYIKEMPGQMTPQVARKTWPFLENTHSI
ncbi:hypothetical protein MferCBS31731_006211 [Microsporum ferrugineum]